MSQYFDNDNTIKSNRRLIEFTFNDKKYKIYTDNGVFSKDGFDYGTRALLNNINIKSIEGKVLDLGCGYGVVGLIIKSCNPQVTVDMVDVNERALKLARENLTLNNTHANIFTSNIYENIKCKYNYIITNPPIRAGKEVIRTFLKGASDHLEDNGTLYFVMRKDHGVKSMIKELENIYKVEVIDKDKGFYVVKCQKLYNND